MGPHGNTTVVESFRWKSGEARLVAEGGIEFDAYSFNIQQLAWFSGPDEFSLIAWGQVLGGSGRCIPGKAVVYRVTMAAVTPIWQISPAACNLTAQSNSVGWEVDFGDTKLVYADDPHPRFFDAYTIDGQRTFHLFVNKRY